MTNFEKKTIKTLKIKQKMASSSYPLRRFICLQNNKVGNECQVRAWNILGAYFLHGSPEESRASYLIKYWTQESRPKKPLCADLSTYAE